MEAICSFSASWGNKRSLKKSYFLYDVHGDQPGNPDLTKQSQEYHDIPWAVQAGIFWLSALLSNIIVMVSSYGLYLFPMMLTETAE